jgi:hypothetical protein
MGKVRAALTPVVLAALILVAGCGGGGGSQADRARVEGIKTEDPKGVWVFHPVGKPKQLVIFFHGQGGPIEATPANHRPWIAHLVERGAAVVYPRYEMDYSQAVIDPAIAGVRRAMERLDVEGLPVLALGYSRGAALAVEYAAISKREQVPVPDAIESVNPVPYGETARIVNLKPLHDGTVMAVLISDADPMAADGASMLLARLRDADFPGDNIELNVARSTKNFSADHLAPLKSTPAARRAYWAPTDALIAAIAKQK